MAGNVLAGLVRDGLMEDLVLILGSERYSWLASL